MYAVNSFAEEVKRRGRRERGGQGGENLSVLVSSAFPSLIDVLPQLDSVRSLEKQLAECGNAWNGDGTARAASPPDPGSPE